MIDMSVLYYGFRHYTGSNVLGGTNTNAETLAIVLLAILIFGVLGGLLDTSYNHDKDLNTVSLMENTKRFIRGFIKAVAWIVVGLLFCVLMVCGMLWFTKTVGAFLFQWVK